MIYQLSNDEQWILDADGEEFCWAGGRDMPARVLENLLNAAYSQGATDHASQRHTGAGRAA